ncbi:MFS transporter [Solirubrobacter sp. CPCC 204708]|uniref:MFS transporter n=1 Tax=Solirubrobacter deserti TaxID=2282478 RepID=A0ABT4REN4_9ACTN|nr:MFS transporter [Solirubrobacter deserti]MBE2318514.1 MFS transporter [Solirubrobacter deserti]MDA0136972.1 MFS transporter [Solirubrobacter deserti]
MRTLPFYIGGFLGPFGGGVVAVLVPQLRDAFDATTAGVAATIPAYLIPFAVLQLVSGTIGERLGRRRVVRTAYFAYALLSLAAAFVPSLGGFLVIRALQGCANAFLTPLLLAGLADLVSARQLGRAVGTFAAVQTAAVALAPLGGGLLGAFDWRLVFLVQSAVAVALALMPPADPEKRDEAPRLRAVLTRRVGLLSGAAFTAYAGVTGIGFLVAVEAADAFSVGSIMRGVLLAGFGVAGMLLGRAAGDAVDRFGRVPVSLVGIAISSALVVTMGIAPSPLALGAIWFAVGLGSALVWAGINVLAVEAVPGNRAGGTSVVSAFKFAGNAVAPLMWLPLYHADPRLGFLGAGILAATAALFIAPLRVAR